MYRYRYSTLDLARSDLLLRMFMAAWRLRVINKY